ncbi:MAG: RHS repeat-associated core domain-containing protein, partial [Pirellulaceae bacterium]
MVDFQQGLLNTSNASISNASISSTTLTKDWNLDQVGNWDGFDQGISDPFNQTRTHNRVNEITGISSASGQPVWVTPGYDDAGNTTLSPRPNDPTEGFTLTFDPWSRIARIETTDSTPKTIAQYTYDGRNHRLAKDLYDGAGLLESTVKFFYNSAWQCLEERATSVVGSPSTATYVWGQQYIDDLICRDFSAQRIYAMQDRQFKTIGLISTTCTVLDRYSYTPYGQATIYDANFNVRTKSSIDWGYLYTTRHLDRETGLYYFRNRYYDPGLGRFCSRDPIRHRGSIDQLCLGAYARMMKFIDQMGLELSATPTQVSAAHGYCKRACLCMSGDAIRTVDFDGIKAKLSNIVLEGRSQTMVTLDLNAIIQQYQPSDPRLQGDWQAWLQANIRSDGRAIGDRALHSALRHCYASALLAMEYGCACAKCLGDWREYPDFWAGQ